MGLKAYEIAATLMLVGMPFLYYEKIPEGRFKKAFEIVSAVVLGFLPFYYLTFVRP